ncbi:alkaline phosphatase D family protein [Alteromonas halophila]|uniref:Alkaline phosphatase n=1 Tax=Alteromonas halophila TaxID=516698 RepID=A0A918MV38_9ALTE|nr:alkaline phosphatase D family protein [Alteromonas halophila]GGW75807.1 alkaline phosphatase [Alteromonas halophila]
MAHLIIGHVGTEDARVWVRGDKRKPLAFVTWRCEGEEGSQEEIIVLEERHDFTGVVVLTGLPAATEVHVSVAFGNDKNTQPAQRFIPEFSQGSFSTAPAGNTSRPFSFLLGSCNLHSLGIISSPDSAFERLNQLVDEHHPDFMIHCGDQIYYDIPIPSKLPRIEEYRDKYKDAWEDCVPAAQLLTRCPHYMILDDHEIRNNFHNDMNVNVGSVDYLKCISLKAYREYQHIHNPQTYGNQALYYAFERAHGRFFVMDTRSERYEKEPDNQLIGERQMSKFKAWLAQGSAQQIHFIVTSVPFVGQVRNGDDKWCGKSYMKQREEVIDAIVESGITRVCFLTGDMHTSYYATMDIESHDGTSVTLHEVMSSPLNQLGKSSLSNYRQSFAAVTGNGNKYKVSLDEQHFYDGHSNVVLMNVGQDSLTMNVYRTKKSRSAELQITIGI